MKLLLIPVTLRRMGGQIRQDKYGGRGIKVCDRWLVFENFFADMGEKPTPKHSIDRIDPNGNYEPGNCRWATIFEQNNNTRRNIKNKEMDHGV